MHISNPHDIDTFLLLFPMAFLLLELSLASESRGVSELASASASGTRVLKSISSASSLNSSESLVISETRDVTLAASDVLDVVEPLTI